MAPANARDKSGQAGGGAAATGSARENAAPPAGGQSRDRLFELTELLFFAYRDFIGEPDEILTSLGFGRAHHRVLHFVSRHPGIRVANLLSILKITKQSLARVLRQLIEEGYVEQRESREDRRRRLLYATPKGAELAAHLAAPQLRRIADALAAAGDNARAPAREFLYNLINESDRAGVRALIAGKRMD
ncbi:MAG: MarR family transcriptional regulator [Rhodobiaceae bacterium]|nr:MarR family transcriptional regulator [Rhodobiaceae bacterium]